MINRLYDRPISVATTSEMINKYKKKTVGYLADLLLEGLESIAQGRVLLGDELVFLRDQLILGAYQFILLPRIRLSSQLISFQHRPFLVPLSLLAAQRLLQLQHDTSI